MIEIKPAHIDAAIAMLEKGHSMAEVVTILTPSEVDNEIVAKVGQVIVWLKTNRDSIVSVVQMVNGWFSATEALELPAEVAEGITAWRAALQAA